MGRIGANTLSNRVQPSASPPTLHSVPAGWIEVSSQVDLPDIRPVVRRTTSSRSRARTADAEDARFDRPRGRTGASRTRTESPSPAHILSPCLPPSTPPPRPVSPQESPVLGAQAPAIIPRLSRTQSLNTPQLHRSISKITANGRSASNQRFRDTQRPLDPALQKKIQRIRIFDGDTISDAGDHHLPPAQRPGASKPTPDPAAQVPNLDPTLQKKIQRIRIFDGDTIADSDHDDTQPTRQSGASNPAPNPQASNPDPTLQKKMDRIRIFDGDTITDHDVQPIPDTHKPASPPLASNPDPTLEEKIQRIRIFDGDTIADDDLVRQPSTALAPAPVLASDPRLESAPSSDRGRSRRPGARISIRTDLAASMQQSVSTAPPPLLDNSALPHLKSAAMQHLYHGQWNLQESHLSEPLISQGRNRSVSPGPRTDRRVSSPVKQQPPIGPAVIQLGSSDTASSDSDDGHDYDKELEANFATNSRVPATRAPVSPAPPYFADGAGPSLQNQHRRSISRMAPPPLDTRVNINDWDANEASPAGPSRPSPSAAPKSRRSSLFRGLGIKLPGRDHDHDHGVSPKGSSEELRQARRKSNSFFKLRNSSPAGLTPSPSAQSFPRSALSAGSSNAPLSATLGRGNLGRPLSAHSPLSAGHSAPQSASSPLGTDMMSSDSIPSSANKSRFSGIANIFRQSFSGPSSGSGAKTTVSHGNLREASRLQASGNKSAFAPGHSYRRSNTGPLPRPASQVLSPSDWDTDEWNGPKSAGLVSHFGQPHSDLQPANSRLPSRPDDSQLLGGVALQHQRRNSPYRMAHGDWSELLNNPSKSSLPSNPPASVTRSHNTLHASSSLTGTAARRAGIIEREPRFLRAHKSANSLASAASAGNRSPQLMLQDLAPQQGRAVSSGSDRLGNAQHGVEGSPRSVLGHTVPMRSSPLVEPPALPVLTSSHHTESPSTVTTPHAGTWAGPSIPRSYPQLPSGYQAAGFPPSGTMASQSSQHFSQILQQEPQQQGTLSKWIGTTKSSQMPSSKGQAVQQTPPQQQQQQQQQQQHTKGIAKSFFGVFKKMAFKSSDSPPSQPQPDQNTYNTAFQQPAFPPTQQLYNPAHSETRSLPSHMSTATQSSISSHYTSYQSVSHAHPTSYTQPYSRPLHEGSSHQPVYAQPPTVPGYAPAHASQPPFDPPVLPGVSHPVSAETPPHLHHTMPPYASPSVASTSGSYYAEQPRGSGTFDEPHHRFAGTPTSHTPVAGTPSSLSRGDAPRSVGVNSPHYHTLYAKNSRATLDEAQSHAGAARFQRQGAGGYAQDKDDEPTMSATAYPGQEWNPYAMASFEDSD
ncbi:uncharacterized protein BROUX77_006189 [Berkeleyomyces rouxiae]|uniref:uncharacterized protein n=1 Tax=Berkeleyomyces rouxiae TaxID=2035830 RepID=UPI003B82C1C1